MSDGDVRYEDGLDPWGYPEYPVEEYAPAQLGEGTTRQAMSVCRSCWTTLAKPEEPCPSCGRPQQISDVEWFRTVHGLCARCGLELRVADEGGCPECGAMEQAA